MRRCGLPLRSEWKAGATWLTVFEEKDDQKQQQNQAMAVHRHRNSTVHGAIVACTCYSATVVVVDDDDGSKVA